MRQQRNGKERPSAALPFGIDIETMRQRKADWVSTLGCA
jgi:hypothetical protein